MKDREILEALMVKLEAYTIALVRECLEPLAHRTGSTDRDPVTVKARTDLLDAVEVAEQLKDKRKQ